MDDLSTVQWAVLIVGSFIMGLSKGGIPGAGNLTVALFVLVLEDAIGPTGVALSVGLLLPVLISADLVSTIVYRKHAQWKYIRVLLPYFSVGVIAGWWAFDFFQHPDKASSLMNLIGIILLSMTAIRILANESTIDSFLNHSKVSGLVAPFLGVLGGMATMLANAAGPIAQFYLLAMKLPKYTFIGTSAWLFLIVNISKVPFMCELGILSREVFFCALWLTLPAIIGALIAPRIVSFIRQDWFERLIWFFIIVAGVRMIL
jgi:uncharacterized membrane protein YfcA